MSSRTIAGRIAIMISVMLVLSACIGPSETEPPKGTSPADPLAAQLASALSAGDVSKLPMTASGSAAQAELQIVMAGMDGLRPTVTASQITYDHEATTATATLEHKLPLGAHTLTWTTTAPLEHVPDKGWAVQWQPRIVQPDLDGNTRLRHVRDLPRRAPINGTDGLALMEQTVAYRVGVDKATIPKDEWRATALVLAEEVGVDPDRYAARVLADEPAAFVPAITLREGKVPGLVTEMRGVDVRAVEIPLAQSATFAASILGTAGRATPEMTKQSKGDLLPGDVVGISGLQQRYDAQLRGTVGHRVEVVPRTSASTAASPEVSGSPAPAGKVLHDEPAKPGAPLVISLDRALQARAEQALAQQKGIASLVALKVGTGEILAAANSPAAGANPDATAGRYAPGSTFKVVSSLALLRKGLRPESLVPCTATTTVDGRVFRNYKDFPSSKVGRITLTEALANSCNTAFLASAPQLGPDDLAEAAASLGMGVDHDAGFTSFFGSVPQASDPVTKAADMIGQGKIEASPMAMAGVAASVASGKTVVPWLVVGKQPTQQGKALTHDEAQHLQTMMRAVVTNGSGRVLSGEVTGAKTGTAEFGTQTPPQTHAWMIAWNDDVAVAALVKEGESGSKSAAPIIKSFLG
ncbi:penicillin-binding transpeptidase domain-containing protein [Luteococcus sp. OSA5]|uniref:penicillin-binding transpeptidase domain-containing protein n=1 Tax=Luteococcus sp. OSA5 TaxID=3401630 RepID=UPI003B42A714